jgi:hypothetical protein
MPRFGLASSTAVRGTGTSARPFDVNGTVARPTKLPSSARTGFKASE